MLGASSRGRVVQRLRSIQVLRAVAACAVVVLHAYPHIGIRDGEAVRVIGPEAHGAAGVDLFFVISGFIMANVAKERTAREFLFDRLWRIYPMWWVAVLPWLLLVPVTPAGMASSLTLWPIYDAGYQFPALKVGWTLGFELLFYIGMTLSIVTRAAVPLAIYALFLASALLTSSPLLQFLGSPMALEFLMGVIVARLPRRAWFGTFIIFGVALFATTSSATGDVDRALMPEVAFWRAIQWGVPSALIVWGALSIEKLFEHRRFDVPVKLGDASYSIYLFHPIIAFGVSLPGPVRILLAVAVGWAMHLLVERRLPAARKRWPALRLRLWPQTRSA